MKKIMNWVQKKLLNAKRLFVNNIYVFIMALFLIGFFIFCLNIVLPLPKFDAEISNRLEYNLKIIQSLTIPLSGIAIIVGFMSNYVNRKKAIMLDKAKVTMSFVSDFRSFMEDMEPLNYIWYSYFKARKETTFMKEVPETKDVLEFDTESYNNFISQKNITQKTIDSTLDITNKNNIVIFYNICFEVYSSGTFSNDNSIIDRMRELLEPIQKRVKNGKKIKNDLDKHLDKVKSYDGSETQDKIDKDNELADKLQKKLVKNEKQILKERTQFVRMVNTRTIEVLNDFECLCMSVKFGLISYEQIYHLVVVPIEEYIETFYFSILKGKIEHEKSNYKIYSNIITMYNSLFKIRSTITKAHNKNAKKADRKLQSILDNDLLSY